MYRWLQNNPQCPVCKSALTSKDKIIPLYGRGKQSQGSPSPPSSSSSSSEQPPSSSENNPENDATLLQSTIPKNAASSSTSSETSSSIPNRPSGQRIDPPPRYTHPFNSPNNVRDRELNEKKQYQQQQFFTLTNIAPPPISKRCLGRPAFITAITTTPMQIHSFRLNLGPYRSTLLGSVLADSFRAPR